MNMVFLTPLVNYVHKQNIILIFVFFRLTGVYVQIFASSLPVYILYVFFCHLTCKIDSTAMHFKVPHSKCVYTSVKPQTLIAFPGH